MQLRYINISEFNPTNFAIWLLLAFQAGCINTGGLLACHRFVSHITGFASHFGFEFASGNIIQSLSMISVPIFFLIGSMLSAILIDHRLLNNKDPKYSWVSAIIFTLIFSAAIGGIFGQFGSFGEPLIELQDYMLLAILCLTCGLQNAAISTASGSSIRTTHLTGLTTDLGIGLIRSFHHQQRNEKISNLARVGIILSFIFGSMISALLFMKFNFAGFLLPAATSLIFFFLTLSYFKIESEIQSD